MARPAKTQGRDKRPREIKPDIKPNPSGSQWRRKYVKSLINEVETAYWEGTNEEVRRLLEEWKVDLKRLESEIEMELVD